MQPIHLGIGIIEGLISGSILLYIYSERPDMIVDVTGEADSRTDP